MLLVDDASSDQTVRLAQELGIEVEVHPANRGYGGNQKTCYRLALERGADIVVMLHPDYQYSPKLVTAMASMVASGQVDVVMCICYEKMSDNENSQKVFNYVYDPVSGAELQYWCAAG